MRDVTTRQSIQRWRVIQMRLAEDAIGMLITAVRSCFFLGSLRRHVHAHVGALLNL
jgi:hypothetical protein